MKNEVNLLQLYKDFFLLTTKVRQLSIREAIKYFLVNYEGFLMREAEKAFPIDYLNLYKEIENYGKELTWYVDNHKKNIHQRLALEKLIFYKKKSLNGLSTIKRDIQNTHDPQREQALSEILHRFISLFNELLEVTRTELSNTSITNQTDWVNLYELNNIVFDEL